MSDTTLKTGRHGNVSAGPQIQLPPEGTTDYFKMIAGLSQRDLAYVLDLHLHVTKEAFFVLRDYCEGKDTEAVRVLITLRDKMERQMTNTDTVIAKRGGV